jgi:hypothetical protein
MSRWFLVCAALLLASCQAEVEGVEQPDADQLMLVKGSGGVNGHYNYCDGAVLCANGEGDCDADTQCDAGLSCVDNLGGNFGLVWTIDVCAPAHCGDNVLSGDETSVDFGGSCGTTCGGTNGTNGYCHPGCPCDAGEGDCNVDEDCAAGLACGTDMGPQYGLLWWLDVCVPAQCTNDVQDGTETAIDFGGECGASCGGVNGDQEGYCTYGCPCGVGEGDCDEDLECEDGLSCILDQGGRYGLDPLHDVCLAPFTVAELLPGDLVISEIMFNPFNVLDSAGEWFEVYNATTNDINLNGLFVQDNPNVFNFTVGVDLILASKDYAIFGRSADTALNGGIVPDYDYVNTFSLADTVDAIVLKTANGGTEIDRVLYNTTLGWPNPPAGSMELGNQHLKANTNHLATSWCDSVGNLVPSGDHGTPGAKNRVCP